MYHCIPMGKLQIQTLTHGYQDCPRFFQNVMSKLVQDMEYVKTYLDDLLILTNRSNSFKDHLLKFQMVPARLSTTGMRVIISNSKFFAEQIEYLASGNWITRQGIQPMCNKVEAILNINAPKTRKNYASLLV
jgi:hypothetical protein